MVDINGYNPHKGSSIFSTHFKSIKDYPMTKTCEAQCLEDQRQNYSAAAQILYKHKLQQLLTKQRKTCMPRELTYICFIFHNVSQKLQFQTRDCQTKTNWLYQVLCLLLKVLLEHRQTYLFIYYLWLLLQYSSKVE